MIRMGEDCQGVGEGRVRIPPVPSEPPTISVVICAFTRDRLEVLSESVDSLRAQTLPAHEIVLVIDHAPELLEEVRGLWPDLKIVENRERRGLSGARNSGVAEATGEIVAFLDDDAIAGPDWLERLAAAYADPNVLGAGGTVRPRWVEGKPGWFPPEFDWVVGCTHSGMPQQLEPVRNLVGANMSFRRAPLLDVGGFSHDLGRVGTLPVGCEETDLSIRVHQRWPEAEILYDPAAAVEHVVPPARGRVRYFVDRCRAEGRSKAVLSGMVGTQDGLSSERSYVRRTLPLGVLRDVGAFFKGDGSGLSRAAMIFVGLTATTVDYLRVRTGVAKPDETEAAHPSSNGTAPRVLMVTPRSPLAQGGVERHVLEVSTRMAAAGVHVEVICTDPDADRVGDQTHEGVRIRTLCAWPRGRDWHFAPGIWRAMGEGKWDLVHLQSYHTLVAPLAMLRALALRVPYVVTFHGGGHSLEHRNQARGLQMRLLAPLLRRAARLVAIARFEIEKYGALLGVPPERFVFIPNGTDLSFSDGDVVGGEPQAPTLASIGRLERYKGHHRVLEAFPLVLERRPEARLLIVGKGPYEGELQRRVEELELGDSVEVTSVPAGDPLGMAALLGRVSLVVLMSEFESHPLVALEAAAARRRLLVADAGGLSEIAADGFGRAIPLDSSSEQIAAAALEELEKPPPQSSPNLTSWDECSAALLDLYASILNFVTPTPDVTSSGSAPGRGQTSSPPASS
jgi:glycosyltransferase involved in cell wall biosynthesis